MDIAYYTIKVTTVNGETHSWKNQKKEDCEMFRSIVWQRGVNIKIDEFTREQVSPFVLKQVLFIQQKAYDNGTMETVKNYQTGASATNG